MVLRGSNINHIDTSVIYGGIAGVYELLKQTNFL